MKIKIVSDLHLEFASLELPNNGADVLILAGDIVLARDAKHNHVYHEFFSHIHDQYKKIIMVPGNHEHYHGNFDQTVPLLKTFLSQYSDVTLLNNDVVKLIDDNGDTVTFIGSTLWTSMNSMDPVTMYYIKQDMNDFRIIGKDSGKLFTPEDAVFYHLKSCDYIKKCCDELKDQKVVVVTHHAPSTESIHDTYIDDYHMNGGYASSLENLILDRPQIKLWVHGHTHHSFDYMIGDTRVICNPRGYSDTFNGRQNNDFDRDILIEI